MPCCIDRLRFSLGIFRFVNFFFFFFFNIERLFGRSDPLAPQNAGVRRSDRKAETGKKEKVGVELQSSLVLPSLGFCFELKGSVFIVGPLILFLSSIHQFQFEG